MIFREYLDQLSGRIGPADLQIVRNLAEPGGRFPLVRIDTPGEARVVISAGFHGNEPAGPLTVLARLPEILDYAASRGAGLHIYPCLNPSGFEDDTRYNRSGERPNNDFLRYEVAPGDWRGTLHPADTHRRWRLATGGAKETRAVRADLRRRPAPVAALDLHQDRFLREPHCYAYTFGDKSLYRPLLEAAGAFASIARESVVDDPTGMKTDADGLIEYHDGSITDWFMRRGTAMTAALETTVDTPIEACHDIQMIWIRAFIDFAVG